MAFSSSQRGQFSERNVAFGERGAKKRRDELAGYAELLQELKNQGGLDFLASKQEFERPEQEARIDRFGAETEGFQLGNEGQRFYQGLAKEFGRSAIMRELGIAEPEGRANVFRYDEHTEFKPKFDTSGTSPSLPGLIGGGGRFRGSGVSGDFGGEVPSLISSLRKKRKDITARPFSSFGVGS